MSVAAADEQLLAACYRGLDPLLRMFGDSEGGSVHEHDGALSCVSPLIPLASLFNSTIYDRERPETLDAALAAMWPVYDESGVSFWSAWIVEGDSEAEAIATRRYMSVNATPRAMGAPLSEIDVSTPTGSVEERWDIPTAAVLNQRGYGVPPGLFGAAGAASQPAGARCFIASHEGEPASVVISLANGEDCAIVWVASDPAAQGMGLAKAAMTAAMIGAIEDGFATTTLQASAAGAPLYARLGYRDLGVAINLWQYDRPR